MKITIGVLSAIALLGTGSIAMGHGFPPGPYNMACTTTPGSTISIHGSIQQGVSGCQNHANESAIDLCQNSYPDQTVFGLHYALTTPDGNYVLHQGDQNFICQDGWAYVY